ncbi:hypothetical protein PBI_TEAMOCIL_43 [Microbacterium phage Teamocil]|uniref:Uncharacterized protein n=1 Tax=Microbacterium phage Teamocil TaxID=2656554 RepID=A0A649VXP8_9CAUD|nr:hypothetical protein QDA12_gp43 [Microbacterium phage Teamocil]QGJ88897.1 hypothetical protein PBI_GINA_43 [Microbacterium phage Gina]QGJ96994.1 hypothetical protein PBI_TEAMOCIL_43 [Microbacterium phage Teamocil]
MRPMSRNIENDGIGDVPSEVPPAVSDEAQPPVDTWAFRRDIETTAGGEVETNSEPA